MFSYAIEVLHFSEAEAYLRILAARASRRHPVLLTPLAEGRLHLSGIGVLAPHLTAQNRAVVLARASYRSKRQIQELVAELSSRPDVPPLMRKLPAGLRPAGESIPTPPGPRDDDQLRTEYPPARITFRLLRARLSNRSRPPARRSSSPRRPRFTTSCSGSRRSCTRRCRTVT